FGRGRVHAEAVQHARAGHARRVDPRADLMGVLDATSALLVAVAGAVVVLMIIIAATRFLTTAGRRRADRVRAEVLPLILSVTDGEDPPLPSGGRRRKVMGQVAASMAHKVRGSDRDALASWLRAHGFLEQAQRGL